MNIGVFDSGDGGRFVVEQLRVLLPNFTYKRVADPEHAPYGTRTYDDIIRLTNAAVQPLLTTCPIIVLACNTATAAAIDSLRTSYPSTIFIGFEPMIKPASTRSKTRRITLLATTATQHAVRTQELIKQYASDCTVDYIDTISWATAIDNAKADTIDLGDVKQSIENGSDSIIIGCTHYIALIPRLKELAHHIAIYEPTIAVSAEISRQAHLLQQRIDPLDQHNS